MKRFLDKLKQVVKREDVLERDVNKTTQLFDFNFKLVVIEELLDKHPSFEDKIKQQRKNYDAYYENELSDQVYFKQACQLFESIAFTKDDLLKVENLTFDGGLEIYALLLPEWDGEDDTFDIHSIKGIEHLPNLKTVEYISIIDETLIEDIKKMGIKVE